MATRNREVTVETYTGKVVTVDVTIKATFDDNYGADADGNRGVGVWEIDETTFKVPDKDDDGALLTQAEKEEVDELVEEELDVNGNNSDDFEEIEREYEGNFDDEDSGWGNDN